MNRPTEAQLIEIEQRARSIDSLSAEMPRSLHRAIGENNADMVYEWLDSKVTFDGCQIRQDIERLVAFIRQLPGEAK